MFHACRLFPVGNRNRDIAERLFISEFDRRVYS
jgi:hypothetical protein